MKHIIISIDSSDPDSERSLAKYLAGLLDPQRIRRDHSDPPPWQKPTGGWQLDSWNDWWMQIPEPGIAKVSHRYNSEKKICSLAAMLRDLSPWKVLE